MDTSLHDKFMWPSVSLRPRLGRFRLTHQLSSRNLSYHAAAVGRHLSVLQCFLVALQEKSVASAVLNPIHWCKSFSWIQVFVSQVMPIICLSQIGVLGRGCCMQVVKRAGEGLWKLSCWCSFRCLHTQLSPVWVQSSPCRLHSCKVQIPVGCWMHIRARCDPPGCMWGVILLVGNADKEFRDPTGPRISLRGIFPVTLLMLSRLEEGGWEDVWY